MTLFIWWIFHLFQNIFWQISMKAGFMSWNFQESKFFYCLLCRKSSCCVFSLRSCWRHSVLPWKRLCNVQQMFEACFVIALNCLKKCFAAIFLRYARQLYKFKHRFVTNIKWWIFNDICVYLYSFQDGKSDNFTCVLVHSRSNLK